MCWLVFVCSSCRPLWPTARVVKVEHDFSRLLTARGKIRGCQSGYESKGTFLQPTTLRASDNTTTMASQYAKPCVRQLVQICSSRAATTASVTGQRQFGSLVTSSTSRAAVVSSSNNNSASALLLRYNKSCPSVSAARYFSSEEKKEDAPAEDGAAGGEENAAESEGEAEAPVSREEELEKEVKDLKDQLLRSLAEQENTRTIAKRDVTSAKNFAVTSFAKSLLDTSDNLSRAMESVPEEYRADTDNHPVLATLYEGIKMTDENLLKAFEKNGLVRYGAVGDKFDPSEHDALFEYPDPNMEVGNVGQVMKAGFKLNDRVIRAAEVGVIKKV